MKINCQSNSPFKGNCFEFKLDFNNNSFNKITDNIIIENNIYYLNFIDKNGYLSIDFKYNEKESFYQNLLKLFNFIYNLFDNTNDEKYSFCLKNICL